MKKVVALFFSLVIIICLPSCTYLLKNRRPVTALYLPAPRVAKGEILASLTNAEKAGVNGIVVDIKDIDGLVNLEGIKSSVPLATERPDTLFLDTKTLFEFARKRGWYVIGRIALFHDACIIKVKPEWGLLDRDGKPFYSNEGTSWCGPLGFTSPYVFDAVKYNADIAVYAASLGFDELQLDYVRFPDVPPTTFVAPGNQYDTSSHIEAITRAVAYIRSRVPAKITVSADIFGFSAVAPYETTGQDAVTLAPYLGVLSPMLYPSLWDKGDLGIEDPTNSPYETIKRSLQALKKQYQNLASPPRIRPWYQAGAWPKRYYGRDEIQAQIKGGHDEGIDEWILWEDEGKYVMEDIAKGK